MQVIEVPDTVPRGQAVASQLAAPGIGVIEFPPRRQVIDDAEVLAVVSPLDVGAGGGIIGALPFSTRLVTSDAVGIPGELLKVDASAGEVVIAPPPNPTAGTYLTVLKIDVSANAVRWGSAVNGDTEGAELLTAQAAATFVFDGVGWFIEAVNTSFNSSGDGGGGGVTSWTEITDKPTFAVVATTGTYDDLLGTPTLPTVPADVGAQPVDADLSAIAALDATVAGAIASDGAGWIKKTYSQLRNSLGLANVATSGAYTDLIGKPVTGVSSVNARTGAVVGLAEDNDARLSDQRTPTNGSVTDAKVSSSAAIAESKLSLASDAAAGTPSRRTLGAGATQAAAGNDARLSDARAWTLYGGGAASSGQVPAWNGSAYVPTTVTASGSIPDATDTVKGVLQLTGDLAGTAAAPTVPGLAARQQFLTPTAVKTSAYTAAANDYVLANVTSAWTLTLPTAPADNTRIGAKITVQPGTNALTIAVGGSDHFNTATGPTTVTMALLNQAVIFQYSAATTTWIGQASDLPLSQLDLRFDAAGAAAARVGSVAAGNATITIGGTGTAPTVAVGTIAESQVTNLTADLAAKTPTSRQVTAGTGLTGGGDLTADRSLAVAYGTTGTTAAAGNDSRITGAAPAASPTLTGTATVARLMSTPVTVAWAATTTIDASQGHHFRITLGGNTTLAMPTNLIDGQDLMVEVIQGSAYTLTLASGWNVTTAITGAVTISTTIGTRSYIGAKYRTSGAKLDVLAFGTGVAA